MEKLREKKSIKRKREKEQISKKTEWARSHLVTYEYLWVRIQIFFDIKLFSS
jgi:hypothetical protein